MRKHTKRKVYGLIYNPIQYVKDGLNATPEAMLNTLRGRELSSLESLAKGKGGLVEWRDMTEMMNLAETLAKSGVGPEVLPACRLAQAELIAAAKRFETTRRMVLTATGLNALRELHAWHDAQRSAISRGEYEKAIETTMLRVKSKACEVVDIAETV